MDMKDKNSQHYPNPDNHPPHSGHPDHSSEDELDIRELFSKLNRRRGAIAGIFVLVVVITGLYLYQATPQYTAQTQLTLDIRKSRVVDIEEVMSGISADASVIGTELDIIQSSDLLSKVVDELNLHQDPEFNPALLEDDKKSLLDQLKTWLGSLWFLEEEKEELSAAEKEYNLKRAIVRRLKDNLAVEHRRQSHTINLAYTSENPRRAAQIADTIAEFYLTDQLEAKFEATRRANEWLAERLENLQMEVQGAEQAVKNVREQSNIIQAGGSTILEQQISDVNAQLIQARVKKSRAEARLRQARQVVNQPGGIESLGEVLDSKTIQQLRADESALRRKRAELSQRYGPKHPEMIQIEAEMADLQDKLEEEANRILESLANEVEVAKAEEEALIQSLNELRAEAGEAMQAELELRELERHAESSRTLYQNFLQRFQETREQDALQRPDARIISPAEVPGGPSHPRKNRTLTLGMAAGLMFGVMGAFLLETLDRGFRTGNQVENATRLPVLGTIPLLARKQGKPNDHVVKKPFSSLAESLRAIRTAIHLSNVDDPPKTIMATSALPGEGKSSFSISLGRISAQTGLKTLVIDTDLRRPNLAEAFSDIASEARLEDLLQGEADINKAIVKDPDSGLDLLMAHGKASAAREMLGSQRMKNLLDTLKKHYDLVILDTPPIMGVSDAWTLAHHMDAVIFLVHWAETPRETVSTALKQMEQLDIRVSGIVLSMVNVRQQAKYGYGGYGYYYGKYKKYYTE